MYRVSQPLAETQFTDDDKKKKKTKKKRKVVRGTYGFGIDGKEVEVEGKMITKRSGKKKFKPKSRKDKKMFRVIDKNKRKNIT